MRCHASCACCVRPATPPLSSDGRAGNVQLARACTQRALRGSAFSNARQVCAVPPLRHDNARHERPSVSAQATQDAGACRHESGRRALNLRRSACSGASGSPQHHRLSRRLRHGIRARCAAVWCGSPTRVPCAGHRVPPQAAVPRQQPYVAPQHAACSAPHTYICWRQACYRRGPQGMRTMTDAEQDFSWRRPSFCILSCCARRYHIPSAHMLLTKTGYRRQPHCF